MPLLLNKSEGSIKVISSKDSSVTCSDEEYEKYLEDLNEERLELDGDPTRFVLKKSLNYKEQSKVKGSQIQVDGKEAKVSLAYIMEEVRQSLVAIEEPDSVPLANRIGFKKGSDGKVDKEIVALLESAGIVSELYGALKNSSAFLSESVKKK